MIGKRNICRRENSEKEVVGCDRELYEHKVMNIITYKRFKWVDDFRENILLTGLCLQSCVFILHVNTWQ